MPLRLIAFLLASALFWSGLGTIEAPWAAAQAAHEQTPGMLPSLATPPGAVAVMARPRGLASAGIGPPFLAGPLRPPSGMARAA